jgi:DNA repair protein RecO (recombination protein O)
MRQNKTLALTLRRTNFGEADRIVNLITPSGKIAAVARGARRQKSKLAGGIEVFSLNEVVLIEGKSDMKTISSARMKEFFGEIIKDLDRTEFGYAAIKQIARASEHIQSAAFFEILLTTFRSLNDFAIPLELTRNWFELNLAAAIGEEINLEIDNMGEKLSPEKRYEFDNFDKVFVERETGRFGADHIKFLRLMLASEPRILAKISGGGKILMDISEIIYSLSGR